MVKDNSAINCIHAEVIKIAQDPSVFYDVGSIHLLPSMIRNN